ncbi:MAG: ribulose-phosphate 3-epimerase [Salinivirgaceae bacterium]|nr:ribulose-phosphate 3-epimerase [Salinivirgaceae bacterium]MDD4746951.1 ribulose-phosphate 3-epimerase [Salinivirgaceae bacterium]
MALIISPSLLSANFMNLKADIDMLNRSQADWLHLDIMDGHFVPNITFGMPIIKQIKAHTTKPLDVHLMIEKPERYISLFRESGADIITVHFEGSIHLHRTIYQIKDTGAKAGVAINPHTSAELLWDILPDIDMVLVMSVNPGYGGQKFIEHSYDKIRAIREKANKINPNLMIQVDGGVDNTNVKKLAQAGANVLVAGSYVFNAQDPEVAIATLKNAL